MGRNYNDWFTSYSCYNGDNYDSNIITITTTTTNNNNNKNNNNDDDDDL